MQKDYLGDDTWASPKPKIPDNGWKRPAGYAAPPGTGPAVKVCRECAHAARRRVGKARHVWKCVKAAGQHFNKVEHDIAAKSPACREFQPSHGVRPTRPQKKRHVR